MKEALLKLTKSHALTASRRYKPHIVRDQPNCVGLVIGQAPPGPRKSLPRGWRPLAGPAEQRLAKLAGVKSPTELWAEFDRTNLLSWYPGIKERSKRHDLSTGYKLHQSDGDVFSATDARRAAGTLDLGKYKCVILLGRNVARAFGVKAGLFVTEKRGGTRLLTFPHPSGVSHYWNDVDNVTQAGRILKKELSIMRRLKHSST